MRASRLMKKNHWLHLHLLAFCLMGVIPASSLGAVLFDGQLGTAPSAQGWFFITDPLSGALSTQTPFAGWTTLDTRGQRTESAGYPSFGHPGIGTLDRSLGFTLSFDIKLIAETHVSTNRAGFSIIAIANDLKGVEVSFWQNQIWVQNDSPLFTHGESVAFNTTTAFVDYDLSFLGNNYQIKANGNTILSGSLRDYSSFGFPYSVPNFVFMGDDTSAASAA
ncbi:hypothetical protein K2Y11_22125, partial [bacterium]|nr:hypothetical protein [bacterium]